MHTPSAFVSPMPAHEIAIVEDVAMRQRRALGETRGAARELDVTASFASMDKVTRQSVPIDTPESRKQSHIFRFHSDNTPKGTFGNVKKNRTPILVELKEISRYRLRQTRKAAARTVTIT